jgi:hypothetical protein
LQIFAALICLGLSFALASSEKFGVLRGKHVFLKKANSRWRHPTCDEKASMFFAEFLKSLKFNQITDPAGSGLLSLCL